MEVFMKIAISVESTHDLSKELIEKYNINVIPFQIVLGEELFKDGEKTTQEIFEYVDKNDILPKTNAINQFEYTEYFEELLKENDAVVHISLSSGVTSSTGNAIMAAEQMQNVFVVDSKSLSTGIGLLAIYARELAEKGESAQDIAQKVADRREKLQVSFVIERMDYLHKGGRCTGFQFLAGNILKIRPRIVLKDGKMLSDKKYRGDMGTTVARYCQDVLKEFNTPDLDKVFITYTSATPAMHEEAYKACVEAGFKNIYQTFAGGTIASHCGGNTLGILYFNDGEQ
jgi:DegV family protein with EDD domain